MTEQKGSVDFVDIVITTIVLAPVVILGIAYLIFNIALAISGFGSIPWAS